MLIKLKILFRSIIVKILDSYLFLKSFFPKSGTLLILRLDDIGDYILFRNFIKHINNSDKFKGYKIYLAGNEKWKELAEEFEENEIYKFIWVNVKKFKSKSEWFYRYSKLFKINLLRCEWLIIPNDTTSLLINEIKVRCGIKNVMQKKSDSVYLKEDIYGYFNSSGNGKFKDYQNLFFQFYRNRKFAEEITGSKIEMSKPDFGLKKEKPEMKSIIIFPGAGDESRAWSSEYFGELCQKISKTGEFKIYICGDNSDKAAALKIKSSAENVIDLTGKTSLTELVHLINKADLLVSNETCSVHIAASVNTKTVCLSNGNHYGRFNPYPAESADFIHTIYPDSISASTGEFETIVKKYYIKSDLDINSIKVKQVFEKVVLILNPANENGSYKEESKVKNVI